MQTRTQNSQRLILLLLLGVVTTLWAYMQWQDDKPVPSPVSHRQQPINLELPPVNSQYIDDQAHLLGPFAFHLHRMAKDWQETLGIEVQIATLRAPGKKIAELTNSVFRERGIGKKADTGGVLILIEPDQKEARIEVSYSLEGVFTDAMVGLIAHDQLAPYASYNVLGMAIMDVLHFMKEQALEQAVVGTFALSEQYQSGKEYQAKKQLLSGGAGAQVDITSVPTDVDFKQPVLANKQVQYMPSELPEQTVEAYKRSLHDYVGYPDLPLFTEGSQIMRASYPFAPYEELLRLRRIISSEPLEIITHKNYALALSQNPAHGFTPILMKRVDGKWRIDMVETWKNLFFDPEGNYYLNNNNTAYDFALNQYGDGKWRDIAPLPVDEGQLKQLLHRLKDQEDAMSQFKLAELLFRNAFVALDALTHYERALTLAPDDPLLQSTYVDRVRYLGFPELAMPYLQKMGVRGALPLAETLGEAQRFDKAAEAASLGVSENPYSIYALRTLNWALKNAGQTDEASDIQEHISRIKKDTARRDRPVWLTFQPKRPLLRTKETINVGGTTVYGHSEFSVYITNHSKRPVQIESVNLVSAGTGRTSGLGDIKDYWQYPSGNRSLKPGEWQRFNKVWGFTVDPKHDRLSYLFHVCWRGVDDDEQQCNTQTIDLVSDIHVMWNDKEPYQGEGLAGLWYESSDDAGTAVLDIQAAGSEWQGRYAQLSAQYRRFANGETVLKGRLNDKGQLEGAVLIKYADHIKEKCTNARDSWEPITMELSSDKKRLQGAWQQKTIYADEGCREKASGRVTYSLDRLD